MIDLIYRISFFDFLISPRLTECNVIIIEIISEQKKKIDRTFIKGNQSFRLIKYGIID